MNRCISAVIIGSLFALVSAFSGTAEAKFVFAQNHPDLEWYTIETEHFHVHYPISRKAKEEGNKHALTAEWSARKMTKAAEESWPTMCAEFNYFLNEKIHVVVLNQGDELQGFTIPTWDWVELSANPGGTFYRGRGRMEWFSDVFVHEFAHVVSLKANAAFSEGTQGVLLGGLYRNGINVDATGQRSVAIGAEVVLSDTESVFWTEGGAEYWSDNTGYNWWTTSRDQNIRMSTLENRLLEYDEWHTRFGKWGWGDSERYYQQGYNFGLYLRQRFGDDTYARFALEHGRRWRWEWVTVVEDVLGMTAEELYWDWREYITERYTAQHEAVKKEGEVVGRELLSAYQEWEFTDPDARDKFMAKKAPKREKSKEGTGTYQWEPRTSGDGRYLGWLNRAVVRIYSGDDGNYPNFADQTSTGGDYGKGLKEAFDTTSFRADFEHGWDFVPGKDAVVVTGREDQNHQDIGSLLGFRNDLDGYNWKTIWYYDMPYREKKVGKQTVLTRERKRRLGRPVKEEGSFYKVPNTERGTDPAMSPDGETMAYFEYTDGTMNLATISLDGSNKKLLTDYKDGTWMQVVDWSPDGSQLVFGIFRNYQQNLYIMNRDGSGIRPIMMDAWEELDAHWSAVDGRIYFSADPTGIFNIFSYDPETEKFRQLTNVIGGAQSPQITADGNLIFNYYTAHGWKIYGLAKDEFLNKDASEYFNTEFDMEAATADLEFEEDLTYFAPMTRKYNPLKSIMAPTGLPMFRLENDGRTDLGLSAGGQIYVQDYVEQHAGFVQGMLGEDTYVTGRYFYQGWYPTFTAGALHYRGKSGRGFLLDEDEDRTTRDDQSIFELKNSMQQNQVFGGTFVQWNDRMTIGAIGSWMNYSVRGGSDADYEPYMHAYEASLFWNFENAYGGRGPNPSGGRSIEANWSHGWTDVTYPSYGGVAIDDGMILDNYQYNNYSLRWTELMQLPTFGIPVLEKARAARHTFQLDMQLGAIDRNVDVNDEFRAGGQHPAYFGYSSVQPNTQFAGYPGWSLSGETMAIFNAAYRFPLNRYGFWRTGPITTNGIYMQLGGTAGNLWSYRPPEDESKSYRSQYDDRIAYNPEDVRREIPFVDEAYKNGNKMLYDAFAEVRVASDFRDGMGWNSFVRLAYGFNEIRGYGDVDGDGIYDTSESGVGDELSSETEPAGWRLYLGLGTGW